MHADEGGHLNLLGTSAGRLEGVAHELSHVEITRRDSHVSAVMPCRRGRMR